AAAYAPGGRCGTQAGSSAVVQVAPWCPGGRTFIAEPQLVQRARRSALPSRRFLQRPRTGPHDPSIVTCPAPSTENASNDSAPPRSGRSDRKRTPGQGGGPDILAVAPPTNSIPLNTTSTRHMRSILGGTDSRVTIAASHSS